MNSSTTGQAEPTTRPVLLVQEFDDGEWQRQLAAALVRYDVRTLTPATGDRPVGHPDDVDPADVAYVVAWRLPSELFANWVNLRGVMLMGAGYDHLDLTALADVPVVRLIDPAMANDIALYVLAWVIYYQRNFDRYVALQASRSWRGDLDVTFPRDFTVGVLGAGAIGGKVLDVCAAQGLTTVGWSRSNHDCSLIEFFTTCDVVVNLVPLSPATTGLVGQAELEALGEGVLINVGRGATVDTDALLDALDRDLRGAVLDVFDTEPLPSASPLWTHPRVVVTPHIAGRTDPATAVPVIASSIASLEARRLPPGTITRPPSFDQ